MFHSIVNKMFKSSALSTLSVLYCPYLRSLESLPICE